MVSVSIKTFKHTVYFGNTKKVLVVYRYLLIDYFKKVLISFFFRDIKSYQKSIFSFFFFHKRFQKIFHKLILLRHPLIFPYSKGMFGIL